jgi:excisionase family DNA binding protein
VTEARLLAPDGGFRLALPAELLERIAERAAELVLERQADAAPATSPYMSIPEAAEYLRCKRQRVDDLLSARKLSRVKDGRRTLVLRAEVERYVTSSGRLARG